MHTHVCKSIQFFTLFTSANYGYIDSIDFPNMYTRTHGWTNHIFIQLAIAVFSPYVTYSYADACRNIFNTIKTSGHSSLEKYTSHFIRKGSKRLRKVLSVRGELETEQNCNILTPQLFWLPQHFFPVLLGCSAGGLGAQPLLGHGYHSSIFSTIDLNFLSPGLYNNLTSTYFLRASHLYSIQPVDSQCYPLIPWYLRPDAPVIYAGAFLIWQPGWVGGQYVTHTHTDIKWTLYF